MVRGANGAFQEDIWMSNFVVCDMDVQVGGIWFIFRILKRYMRFIVAFQNDICKFKWVVGDMWMSKWVVCGVCFEFQGDK